MNAVNLYLNVQKSQKKKSKIMLQIASKRPIAILRTD